MARKEKLLLETILERSVEKYGLRLLEEEGRYDYALTTSYGAWPTYNAHGIRERVNGEKALNLKLHPLSVSNISYELVGIYNEKRGRFFQDGYIYAGKSFEAVRFRTGRFDSARIMLTYYNKEPCPRTEVSPSGDFDDYLITTFKANNLEYRNHPRLYSLGNDHFIDTKNVTPVVEACVKYMVGKYEKYLNYARRQIELSASSKSSIKAV